MEACVSQHLKLKKTQLKFQMCIRDSVSPLIKRGQSVNHIFTNNPNRFNLSEKTVYRYVAGGLMAADNLDMPRVVRFKPRKTKPVEHNVDISCRIGRNYLDFKKFVEEPLRS